jgi:hypothetical protein
MTVAQARCANHELRMAAGKCGTCGRFFCRECVTEHGVQLRCAACLRATTRSETQRRARFRPLLFPAMAAGALLFSWLVFFFAGETMQRVTAPPAIQTTPGVR